MTSYEPPPNARGTKMETADAIVAMAFANQDVDVPLVTLSRMVVNLYHAGYMIARPDLPACAWTRPDVCGYLDPSRCATHGPHGTAQAGSNG